MKKRWILLSAFCTGAVSYAQVGIGTATPNPSAQLEITSDKRGVLIPQIALKNLTDDTTISSGNVESLLVYNTANNGTVKPGYYYWKQNSWTRLLTEIDDKGLNFPTNSKFVVEDGLLKLYDTEDNVVFIAIEELNIITTLVKDPSGNGQYTYTNEAGTAVIIDVPADVINNFEEIINNANVQEIINTIINTVGGNVHYDGNSFTYTDATGTHVIDIEALVKANETVTTLVKDPSGNGQYTYTNEEGDAVVIDVLGDVINNFEEITNNAEFITKIINKLEGKYGNVFYNVTEKKFYYIKADGTQEPIDWSELNTTNKSFTLENDMLTVTDTDGNSVQLDVKEIANNATFVTELSNNDTLITKIISKLEGKYGNVVYNEAENKFYYIKADGTKEPIDWSDLNTINESFTLENDQLVITDSDGNSVELSLADIASNKIFVEHIAMNQDFITKLGDNTDFITMIIDKLEGKFGNVGFDVDSQKLFYYDENYNVVFIEWKDIFEANETITTIEKDSSGNGKYIYTNEAGDTVVIDIPAEVINNFETIIGDTNVETLLKQFITYNGYVQFDGEHFTYVNQSGDVVMISVGDLVRMHETVTTLANVNGVITYTNEAKTTVEVDIPALVKANETLTTLKNVEVISEDEDGDEIKTYTLTYTDEAGGENPIDIEVLVRGHETITTLEYDPANYILTYTNEVGLSTVLKLKELVEGGESLTKLEFDTATNSLLYTDENQVIHTIEIDAINKHPWLNSSTHKIATNPSDNIYTKGWVGIGFTEPSNAPSEKLRVNGSITAVNSYYADYVFENYFDGYSTLKYDYKFKSLDVVEDFIKTNRHLPGITPIHELNKTEEGYAINVSELSVQLLEKTEELYLHIIDQNKELEEKEARIKELEQANQGVQQKVEQLEQMLLEFMQKN